MSLAFSAAAAIKRKAADGPSFNLLDTQKTKVLRVCNNNDDRTNGSTCSINNVPPEILCQILSRVGVRTLMVVVPRVCKLWRHMCPALPNVHLDFTWAYNKHIPAAVFDARCGMGALFRRATAVSLTHNHGVQDTHMVAMANKFPDLTFVNVRGCWQITDAGVRALAKACPRITHANFRCCTKLTDEAVRTFATECGKNLSRVNLAYLPNMTIAAVFHLAGTCSSLVDINLSGCKPMTDAAACALARACRALTTVKLNQCNQLTDEAVRVFAETCRQLTRVEFSQCSQLTNKAVVALAETCRQLSHVEFFRCQRITLSAVQRLLFKCDKMVVANFSWCWINERSWYRSCNAEENATIKLYARCTLQF